MSEDVKLKLQIEESDVFSSLPLFQLLEMETGPKGDSGDWIQLWHGTGLLPCSIPDDPLGPAPHGGDSEGASLLSSCLSEIQLLPFNPLSVSDTYHRALTWSIRVFNAHHTSAGDFGCHCNADSSVTVVTGSYSGAGIHVSSSVL